MSGETVEYWVGTLVSPIEGLKPFEYNNLHPATIVGTLVSPIEGLKQPGRAFRMFLDPYVGTLVSPIEGLKHFPGHTMSQDASRRNACKPD